MTATGIGASSLTGQNASGDYVITSNEYRNFQIRIVEDIAIPTACGQRALITSHTAGPNPVYTIYGSWTVTPSATAKYVIENCGLMLLFTSGSSTVYTYAPRAIGSMAANTWSSSRFSSLSTSIGAGVSAFQTFGQARDYGNSATMRSRIWILRGGGAALFLSFDIAYAADGLGAAWSIDPTSPQTYTTGASMCYDPLSFGGDYAYLLTSGSNLVSRLSISRRTASPMPMLPTVQGTAVVGNKMACSIMERADGKRYSNLYVARNSGQDLYQMKLLF